MSLADCLTKADALNAEDRAFIEDAIARGVEDNEILNMLEQNITTDVNRVAKTAIAQGLDLAMKDFTPDVIEGPTPAKVPYEYLRQTYEAKSEIFYSNSERWAETVKLQQWNPSRKNPEGRASGKDIWNKYKADSLPKGEREWLGLEEWLTATPNAKFTREEVLQFMQEKGFRLIETIADDQNVTDSGDESDLRIDDNMEDDSEREYFIDDRKTMYMDDWDFDDPNQTFFDADEQRDYVISEHVNDWESVIDQDDLNMDDDEFAEFQQEMYDANNWEDAYELLEQHTNPISYWEYEVQEEAERRAQEMAESDWLDEPSYIWYQSMGDSDFEIRGSYERDFRLEIDGDYIGEYSTHEDAVEAAREWARENDIFQPTEFSNRYNTIQQGSSSYRMRGESTNYREIKIKAPDIAPPFMYTSHYQDPNIIAFLRVDDRKLYDGPAPELTADEARDTESPQNMPLLRELRENFNEEKMEEFFESDKEALYQFYVDSGAPTDLINWERMNDHNNWPSIQQIADRYYANKNMYPDWQQKFNNAQARIRTIRNEMEANNQEWNTDEMKRDRAGKGKIDTYFVDEFQSDWQSEGRKKGFRDDSIDVNLLQQQRDENVSELADIKKVLWWKGMAMKGRWNVEEWGPMEEEHKSINNQYVFYNRTTEQFGFYRDYLQNTDQWHALGRSSFMREFDGLLGRDLRPRDADEAATLAIMMQGKWSTDRLTAQYELIQRTKEQITRATEGITPAPFVQDDAWITMGLKRALINAAEKGYKAFAWPNSKVLENRWSSNFDYVPQYDQKMFGAIKRLTKMEPTELVLATGEVMPVVKEPRVDISSWKYEWSEAEEAWEVEVPEIGVKEWVRTENNEEKLGAVIIPRYSPRVRMLEFYEPYEVEGVWRARDRETGLDASWGDGTAIAEGRLERLMHWLTENKYNEHYPPKQEGYYTIPITDELRAEITTNGYPMFQTDRGRFYPGEMDNIIQLTKTSDLSTFLHEGAHLFLEVQKIWTEKYGITPNQQAMLDYLGIDDFNQLTTELHEQWAESFEVYLREGKAPSLQLRQAFAAFARWLKKIYRTLRDGRLLNAKLDDDLRNIFNRMLATEEQIAEAAARPEYDQYFRNQQQAGMNDRQWEEYQRRVARARDQAEMEVDEKIIKQYMKTKQAAWKKERDNIIPEMKERIGELPVYKILKDVQGDKVNNIPAVPFSTDELRKLFPEGKIPKHLAFKHSKDGIDPAYYAEQYGFASAMEMLEEVMRTPPLGKAAQTAAEIEMRSRYGDIMKDGTLEAEAREALLNENGAEILQLEINAMSKKKGRESGINRAYLKAKAIETISKMRFKEIQPSRYYRAMVKHAKDSMIMGDPTDAKIGQLANHYLYKEAVRVKNQMEKHRRYVKSVQRRRFDTKKIDSEYAQRMKMLAEMYLLTDHNKQRENLSDILNFFTAQVQKVGGDDLPDLTLLDPNLIRAMEHREQHGGNLTGFQLIQFDDMQAQDLHGVVDMLRHLSFVGREVAAENGEAQTLERMELIESIRQEGGKDHPVQRGRQVIAKGMREKWNYLVNSMPSIINMTRKLDGMEEGGVAQKLILQTLDDANNKKLELNRQYYQQFEEMVGPLNTINLSRMDGKTYTFQDGQVHKFSSEEAFMMGLYWGTQSSRDAVREGWNATDQDVMSVLSSLTEGQLKYLNIIWSMNETHWPQLAQAAIMMEGYAPPKLEAAPFTVKGVELTGGHMQLFYDSQRLDLKNEQEIGTRKGSVMPTKAGSLNARVGSGGMPVMLDLNNITRSLDDKIHYIAFAEAGRKLRRLINHKEVVAVIERKHGSGFYQAYVESIEAVSSNRGAQETHKTIAAISRWMRTSATMMNLMYSIRNTAQQFSAIHIAMEEVGPLRYIDAVSKLLSDNRSMVRMVHSKSKFMQNRKELINRDSREALKQYIRTSKIGAEYQRIVNYGFMFQIIADSTVAYPTWVAAYQKGMDNHGDERQARLEADSAVGQSVGSGSDLHLGRIMQSNQGEVTKTLTIFGSWFNAYYQRLYHSSQKHGYISPQFAMQAVVLPFIAANLAQALILDTPDTEDDESMVDWMIKNYWMFMLGTIPVIREISSINEGFTPAAPIMSAPKAFVRAPSEIAAYLEGTQTGLKTTVDVGRAVASIAKVPGSGQVLRIADYWDSYLEGEEEDFGLLGTWQMFVEGRNKE